MKQTTNRIVRALAAAGFLLITTDAMAELSVRDRCETALQIMGVETGGTERGWASLCAGVVNNEPITRYGNWYGPGYWGGGEDDEKAGLAVPLDSLDAVAQRHDYGYLVAEKYGKIYGKQYEFKLKAMADKIAVRDAMNLPQDPRKWDQVPADPDKASRYRDRMITGFIIESDVYKNLADATKVGDAVTSPFITMFDKIDYTHVPDLDKFEREVSSHINGWKKEVAKHEAHEKKLKEAAEKSQAARDKEIQKIIAEQQAEKDDAARKAKDAKEAEAARQRLKEKIEKSKQEPEEKSESETAEKKSYADMTPEERREALKQNDDEAWKALTEELTGGDKENDTEAGQTEGDSKSSGKTSSEIPPLRVTASGSFDEDYSVKGFPNIVTTSISISFWNVGSQVSGYGDAMMKSKAVSSLNGSTSESACGGTFSGGPNGGFQFYGDCGGMTLGLRGGTSIHVDEVVLRVSNPSAFSYWEK